MFFSFFILLQCEYIIRLTSHNYQPYTRQPASIGSSFIYFYFQSTFFLFLSLSIFTISSHPFSFNLVAYSQVRLFYEIRSHFSDYFFFFPVYELIHFFGHFLSSLLLNIFYMLFIISLKTLFRIFIINSSSSHLKFFINLPHLVLNFIFCFFNYSKIFGMFPYLCIGIDNFLYTS